MPKRETFRKNENDELEENEKNIDLEYIKSQPLSEFLKYPKLKNILLDEHIYNFEQKLKYKLEELYKKLNFNYRTDNFLDKDEDSLSAEEFANIVYRHINLTYDLSIFYENMNLVSKMFSSIDN